MLCGNSINIKAEDLLDSLNIKFDSTAKKEKVILNKPLQRHGSISLMPFFIDEKIDKHDLLFSKYQTFSELLREKTNLYPLNLGVSGQFNTASFFGLKPNNTNITFNNRSYNSQPNGLMNLDIISPEFLESIEILQGSKAVVLSSNSSPILINLQEIKYNTGKSYTKLWYNQGGFEYIHTDAVFSQNIAENLNFTFGFKRISSPGKYDHTWADLWNLRGILRWNLSESTNISLSENFNNSGFGNSGGIDIKNSTDLTDKISSPSIFYNSNERNFNHNINLTLSHYFDSLTAFSSTAYFSSDLYEFRLARDYAFENQADTNEFTKSNNYFMGINSKLESEFSIFKTISGADLSFKIIDKSNFWAEESTLLLSGYEYVSMKLSDLMTLSGGARILLDGTDIKLNLGANLKYILNYKSFIDFDYSITNRKYNPNEILNNFENIRILKSNYKLIDNDYNFELGFSFNQISNYLLQKVKSNDQNILNLESTIIDNVNTLNLGLKFNVNPFDNFFFTIKGDLNYSLSNEIKDFLPLALINLDLYYEFKRSASILQLGIQTEGMTQYYGYRYIPYRKVYALNDTYNAMQFDGISAYINAKFSTAYIKVIMTNILSQPYYYVPYYPMYGTQFKVIVNIPFID